MENRPSKFLIVLIILFIVVMMIPITALVISPSNEPEPLTTPLFELNNKSLNDVFTVNYKTTDIVTLGNQTLTEIFTTDYKTTDIIALNNQSLTEMFSTNTSPVLSNLVTNGGFDTNTTGWTATTIGSPSVSGGIVSFTATAVNGAFSQNVTLVSGNVYYAKTRLKVTASASQVEFQLFMTGSPFTDIGTKKYHSGGGAYEVLTTSGIAVTTAYTFRIIDRRTASWSQIDLDYMQLFNLTASHGVTATTGTAYDLAVAEIEATLLLNNGYVSSIYSFYLAMGDLNFTVAQTNTYYQAFLSTSILLEAFNEYNNLAYTQQNLDDLLAQYFAPVDYTGIYLDAVNDYNGTTLSQAQLTYYYNLYLYYLSF